MSPERTKRRTSDRRPRGGGTAAAPASPDDIVIDTGPFTITIRGVTFRVESTTLVGKPVSSGPASPPAKFPPPSHQFRRKGGLYQVVFEGGQPFYVVDTLGARYLDYLLHHPNVPIGAFDLEVAITPEKREARASNSIQPESDAEAKRQYREAVRRTVAARQEAEAAGDREELDRLDGEIEALKSALKDGREEADTGERARHNVRKALDVVIAKLANGDREEKAFAEHLRIHLSTGYECLYSQSEGRIWK